MKKIEIKKLTNEKAIIAGYGVVFGGRDTVGETFDKNTDLMLDLVPVKPVFYDHRMVIKHKLGKVIKERVDDLGVWIEAEIERSKEYANEVLKLIKDGRLGWSSGSAGLLVERLGKNITQWPIIEFSLTPTPAEPRTLGVQQIKSVFDVAGSEVPKALKSAEYFADRIQDAADSLVGVTDSERQIFRERLVEWVAEHGSMPDYIVTDVPMEGSREFAQIGTNPDGSPAVTPYNREAPRILNPPDSAWEHFDKPGPYARPKEKEGE